MNGKKRFNQIDELISVLIEDGGAIILSSTCSEKETKDAQANGRLITLDAGICFVPLTKDGSNCKSSVKRIQCLILAILIVCATVAMKTVRNLSQENKTLDSDYRCR